MSVEEFESDCRSFVRALCVEGSSRNTMLLVAAIRSGVREVAAAMIKGAADQLRREIADLESRVTAAAPTPRTLDEKSLASRVLAAPALSEDESVLLTAYRALNDTARPMILEQIVHGQVLSVDRREWLDLFSSLGASEIAWLKANAVNLMRGGPLTSPRPDEAHAELEPGRGSWAQDFDSVCNAQVDAQLPERRSIRVYVKDVDHWLSQLRRKTPIDFVMPDGDRGPWLVERIESRRDGCLYDVDLIRWHPAKPSAEAPFNDSACSAQGEVSP